jgi:hypothetical protein
MNCQTQFLLQRNFITRIRSLPGGIPPTGEYSSSIVLPSFISRRRGPTKADNPVKKVSLQYKWAIII